MLRSAANLKTKFSNLPRKKKLAVVLIAILILVPTTYAIANKIGQQIYISASEQLVKQNQSLTNQEAFLPEISDAAPSNGVPLLPTKTASKSNTNIDQNSDSSNDSSSDFDTNSSENNSSNDSSSNDSSSDDFSDLPSCGSNYSFFTISPVSLSNLSSIIPLGNLNPSGHTFPTDHVYPQIVDSATVALYAPGNVTITQISAVDNYTQGTTDYSIYFKPCSEVEVYYLHVKTITTKLSNELVEPYGWDSEYSTGGTTYRNRGKNMSLSVSAGEEIGTTSSFDIGTRDARITLSFANPARWTMYGYDHTVCPLDYYSGSLKDNLRGLLKSWTGTPRTIEPICGTVEQDIAGTAQGAWFISGTSNSWSGEDPHLALVHDNIDPTQAIFSVGTSMSSSDLTKGTYGFYPTGLPPEYVNRDFYQVSVNGHIYCYRPNYLDGRIILQLTNSTTLKIERQSGNCDSPPWSFTGNATEFER